MMRGTRLWAVVILAGVGAGLWWRATAAPSRAAPTFRTVQVTRGDLERTIMATGQVQPENRLEIKPPIGGRIETVLVEEGQPVTKGQLLAWLSSTERAALLDAARAKGPGELAHWEELYRPTPLMAPLDGVVIARNVEPGQTVTATDAVLVMSDRLIVKASVDETDIGQVRVGQAARITLDAYPDDVVEARVDHVAYEAKTVNNVTTYEVDVVAARIPDVMRSGMTANVMFVVEARPGVLLLPAESLTRDDGRSTVLVPGPAGRPGGVRRAVTVGLSNGKQMEIVSGLAEGDAVLVPTLHLPHRSGAGQGSPFSPFGSRRRS